MSLLCKSIKKGHTYVFSTVLDKAPASKCTHSELRLLRVRQIIPARHCFNSTAISPSQSLPASMSHEETQGSTSLITCGSHFLRISATAPLFLLDQLMNKRMS